MVLAFCELTLDELAYIGVWQSSVAALLRDQLLFGFAVLGQRSGGAVARAESRG
jgi:hypothetical protein